MRYLLLIIFSAPIVLFAIINIVTKFKMHRITKRRFRIQLVSWLFLLVALITTLPIYNLIAGDPIFSSYGLSVLDIIQTTAIVVLFFIINDLRIKQSLDEKRLRDLHQELSIRLAANEKK